MRSARAHNLFIHHKKIYTMELRYLRVTFDMPLQPYQITSFRGAIVAKVGREHHWFHNHQDQEREEDAGGFYQRYPLIQYKCDQQRPMILFLGDCVEEAHRLFNGTSWSINFRGEEVPLPIKNLDIDTKTIKLLPAMREYTIFNWTPLNQRNFDQYKQLDGIVAKTQFLEHLLQSYILSFASGIGWFVADPIETRISEIKAERYIEIKHNHVLGFTLRFKTNVDLPDYIGLGRAAARGLGMVRLFNSQSPIYKKDLIK